MKLSQLVRDRLNEITEWRSQGESWLKIDGRFRALGQDPGTDSVRTLYRKEMVRRRSPEREAALRWANSNYRAIKDLLDQGYDWTAILILVPPDFDVDPGGSGITKLVSEFMSIDRLRSTSGQVPSTAISPDKLPNAGPKKTPDGEDKTKPQVSPAKVDSATAQPTVPRLRPKPGTILTNSERLGLTPKHNPFESAHELRERVDAANLKSAEIYRSSLSFPEEERDAAKQRHVEASREYDQLNVDYLYSFSDFRAKYSKLHLLAAKALQCGAFEVVDPESENAIMLQGYDRPDAIEGLHEVPEPLFIRENLSAEELAKIEEAYKADGLELSKRSPLVRLAEALCMRGEYLFRGGWREYDTMVRLEGDDFPSPTLCNANKWQIRSRAIELWPKLTGDEPVQPSEYERKRLTYRPDPELEKRGEWK